MTMKRMRKVVILELIMLILLTGCKSEESAKSTTTAEYVQRQEMNQSISETEFSTAESLNDQEVIESQTESEPVESAEVAVKPENDGYTVEPDAADFLAALRKTQDPGYILENSDSSFLTEEDISDFSKEKLRMARNEIFARHGRTFEDKIVQAFFYTRSWYHEVENCEIELNEYESKNCELIQKREDQLASNEIQAPEQDGWQFIERKDNGYSYHGMVYDPSKVEYDEKDICHSAPIDVFEYNGKEYRVNNTWMQSIYKVAARTADDESVMILITGEDDTDNIYTVGYKISPEGIEEIVGGGPMVACMDEYVCFWYGGFSAFSDYYSWCRIDAEGKEKFGMGAFCTPWIRALEKPIEVNVKTENGSNVKETVQTGERLRLISRLTHNSKKDENNEYAMFLVLQRETDNKKVWIYVRDYMYYCKDGLPFTEHFKVDGSEWEGAYALDPDFYKETE